MYLRTTKRKNRDGNVVQYYQLAHNERHPETKVSTPRVIHSFGRADLVNRDERVRLGHSIAKACGLVIHDPFAEADKASPFDKGLPRYLTLIGTVEFGTVVVIEALWLRLGIGQVFKEMVKSKGYKASYERALLATTANRLCDPPSKLGVWERWPSNVFLPSCKDLKLADRHAAMDVFHKHCSEIEQRILFSMVDLFNLDVNNASGLSAANHTSVTFPTQTFFGVNEHLESCVFETRYRRTIEQDHPRVSGPAEGLQLGAYVGSVAEIYETDRISNHYRCKGSMRHEGQDWGKKQQRCQCHRR
jgi:hypothetical protein